MRIVTKLCAVGAALPAFTSAFTPLVGQQELPDGEANLVINGYFVNTAADVPNPQARSPVGLSDTANVPVSRVEVGPVEPAGLTAAAASPLPTPEKAHDFRITITNQCKENIWPAVSVNTDSPLLPTPTGTGSLLPQGESRTMYFPVDIVILGGRIFARQGCETDASGHFQCAVGDCKNGELECPRSTGISGVSLAEFTVVKRKFWYNLSLIDGFNVGLKMGPAKTPSGTTCQPFVCETASCDPKQAYLPNTPGDPVNSCEIEDDSEFVVTFCGE